MKYLIILLLSRFVIQTTNSQNSANIETGSYENRADSLFKSFQYDSASIYYCKAARLYERDSIWLISAKNYRLAGHSLNNTIKSDSALYYIQRALNIADIHFSDINKEEMFEKSDILIEYGINLQYEGKYEEELLFFNKALQLVLKSDCTDSLRIVKILNNKGIAYDKLRKTDSALFFCEKAFFVRNRLLPKNHLDIAESYFNTGHAYYNAGNFDKALEYYQEALKIRLSLLIENHPEVSICYTNIGTIYWAKGEYDKALEYYQKALELQISVFGDNHPYVAGGYHNIGMIWKKKGEFDKALEYDQKALSIRIKILGEMHPDVADSYNNIGTLYTEIGKYDTALACHQKALKIYNSSVDIHPNIANCYGNMGNIFFIKGKYDTALDYYQKALDLRIKTLGETHPEVAVSYINLGMLNYVKGDYTKALEYDQNALKIRFAVLGEMHPQTAYCYDNIGLDYYRMGDYYKALDYLQKALKIRVLTFGDEMHHEIANTYNNIGNVNADMGGLDIALEYYQKALKIHISEIGEICSEVAKSYNNIGTIYGEKGDYVLSQEYLKKALGINISVFGETHPEVAKCYNNIGINYFFKKDYDNAIENYQKALQVITAVLEEKSPLTAEFQSNIAQLFYQKNDYQQALQYYQKALINNLPGFNDTCVYANPVLENVLSKPVLLETLSGKASTLFQLYKYETGADKDLNICLSTYELAFNLTQTMRNEYNIENTKLVLSERTKDSFIKATHAAIEYDKTNPTHPSGIKAFEYIEKGKSAILAAEFTTRNFNGIPDSLIEEEKYLKYSINTITTELAKEKSKKEGCDTFKVYSLENESFRCSRKLDSLIISFETNYPSYYDLKYTNKIVSVSEIQKSLDHNTSLLNYSVGDSSLFIATITDSLYNIREIMIDSSFKQLITKYYKNLKTAEPGSLIENSQLIYKLLISPVKEYIAQKEHLIIIPDDYLYYLPFETLIETYSAEKDQKIDYPKLDYLIKDHSVTYNHSATVWYNSRKKVTDQSAKPEGSFIGFAPVFNKEHENGIILSSNINVIDTTDHNLAYRSISTDMKRFNPLPYSKDEVTSILHLFEKQKREAKAYLYSQASESNFKNDAGNYSFVHISSHGFSNDKEPKLSGIVFSQPSDSMTSNSDQKEDGILYAGETYTLNLMADLVVLSSCESGLGKLVKGEGLLALSRGFLSAGSPNVVFSLWKALDKPTQDLMIDFYSSLLDGQSYSEALRQAKLNLINDPKTAFPHFWGGFVLMGQ